jgi:hypothetical protein
VESKLSHDSLKQKDIADKQGRNTKGEEGLFPATYIEEIPTPAETTIATEPAPVAAPAPITKLEPKNPGVPAPEIISMNAAPTIRADESESPKGGNSMLDIASSTATAAVVGVSNVMGKTIHEVQQAIENIQKDKDSDDEGSLGIGTDTRAKLAEQAKLANEQRDKQRTSMGVTGLVYSDDSGDEGDDGPSPYFGGIANGDGNGNGNVNGDRNGPIQTPPLSTVAATALPTTSVGQAQAPAPLQLSSDTDLADRLGPALSLPSTPPLDKNATIPAKPPASWNVEDVVSWAIAKGFDDSICQKFRGKLGVNSLGIEADQQNTRLQETCCLNLMPTCSKNSTFPLSANDSVSPKPSLSSDDLGPLHRQTSFHPGWRTTRPVTHSEACRPLLQP